MHCDIPLAQPAVSSECLLYRPGLWEQDLYTLPLAAAIVTAVSRIDPPTSPRWPFDKEAANEVRNPSRQPGLFAGALAGASLIPLVTSISAVNSSFSIPLHLRGLIHTHLWTELFTSSAKVYFGRKRPFFDTVERRGEVRRDDRFSFFSGHASHAFAFATYASQLALHELKPSELSWTYVILLNTSAAWVAASRAVDKQHNWSDILTGAAVGSTVGYLVFNRVVATSGAQFRMSLAPRKISFNLELSPH